MKNIVTSIFFIIAFSVGVFVLALIYFVVVYGVLTGLSGSGSANAARLGEQIGAVAGAFAFPGGSYLFVEHFWDRLVRENGAADHAARVVAGAVMVILTAFSLFALAAPAVVAATSYKPLGMLLTVAFGFLIAWLGKAFKQTKS